MLFQDLPLTLLEQVVDPSAAAIGDTFTLGYTTQLREDQFGDWARQQHEGNAFKLGQIATFALSFGVGANTPNALKGVSGAGRLAQGFDIVSTFSGSYESTTNFLEGCFSLPDLLNFAPLLGVLGSRLGRGDPNSGSSSPSQRSQEIFDRIQEGVENGDFTVKSNPLNPDTLQESNLTIDFGDGTGVNLRTETHPLQPGGSPTRHTNVEVTRRTPRGRNRVIENIHITQ
ncbi:hypothetical protein [Synechococcus sp. PCC 7336]|uniref:hypothetical protein n=1 Tax=Synechococcus sp. PCC 7336 TaxID=195250 RepID=UPI000344CE54|nr:hypothetical protein [Synechococcus sp. PCC 7336]